MNTSFRRSRFLLSGLFVVLLLRSGFLPAFSTGAVGCGPEPQLPAASVQAQERWRYSYDGAGGYDVLGWSPSEVALIVNSQGCALYRTGVVGLNLFTGEELWRVTADEWNGSADLGTTLQGDLVIVPTTETIYAYDLTTGELRWSLDHGFEAFPQIVSHDQQTLVVAFDNALIGIDGGAGTKSWQILLPVDSIADWEDVIEGPLVAIGRPAAGQDVLVFGIDRSSGALLWQTPVGETVASSGGNLDLASGANGRVVADVSTDGTSALVALTGTTGAVDWTVPLVDDGDQFSFGRLYITNGDRPAVVSIVSDSQGLVTATGYDGAGGTLRWQNQNIADAILVDQNHLVGAGPAGAFPNALVMVDGETGETVWSQPYALLDGSFPGTAQVSNNELIFVPVAAEGTAPAIMSVDWTTGNINWANSFPEFDMLTLDGLPAGLVLVTGDTADKAVAVALTS